MTGQKDKAVHHMQILVDAHPEWKKDRMLSYIISRNYIALNQKDRGLAYYQDYLSHDANPARGHLDYARFLTQSGKLSYNRYSQKRSCTCRYVYRRTDGKHITGQLLFLYERICMSK